MSEPKTSNTEQKTPERLLRSREAQGLNWSMSARLAVIAVVILLTPMLAFEKREAIVTLTIVFVGGVLSIYSWKLARKEEHLKAIGLAGVGFDMVFLSSLPFVWHQALAEAGIPFSLMLKQPFETAAIIFMVINTMAIRPLYPAIIATGSIALKLAIVGLVLSDPRALLTGDRFQALVGPEASLKDYATSIIVIALVGAFLTFLAKVARRTVYDVVELEEANLRIKKEQARMILEVKMAGLANLVAGIAHEISGGQGVPGCSRYLLPAQRAQSGVHDYH
jgi:adenylate cyclase